MLLFDTLTPEQEADFRQWARQNYKPFGVISGAWHPVIQEECTKMNSEARIEDDFFDQLSEFEKIDAE